MTGATRFKICGLTRPEDVDGAVAVGAAALGFNFYPASPRFLQVEAAAALAARVPLWVDRVALFVDGQPESIRATAAALGSTTVQLHGRVTPELCRQLAGLRIIAAVAAKAGATLKRLEPLLGLVDAVLLDAAVPGLYGGTGQTGDWDEAAAVCRAIGPTPMLLAGGLGPHNVLQAIERVRPYGVDVASGVESAPGVKDPQRLADFAAAVRRAE
jgi:phosphoribosylanthranilate isomerase